jgi:hypothetical protein
MCAQKLTSVSQCWSAGAVTLLQGGLTLLIADMETRKLVAAAEAAGVNLF